MIYHSGKSAEEDGIDSSTVVVAAPQLTRVHTLGIWRSRANTHVPRHLREGLAIAALQEATMVSFPLSTLSSAISQISSSCNSPCVAMEVIGAWLRPVFVTLENRLHLTVFPTHLRFA